MNETPKIIATRNKRGTDKVSVEEQFGSPSADKRGRTESSNPIGSPSPGIFDLFPDSTLSNEVRNNYGLFQSRPPTAAATATTNPHTSSAGLDMLVHTAAESPMAANIEPQKYFPTSKDWSPFIKYGVLEDDLSFLNSPTPRIPPRPNASSATQSATQDGLHLPRSDRPPSNMPTATSTQQFWSNANLPSYPTEDLLAIQSARLLSNKMALQDRLNQNTGASSEPSIMSTPAVATKDFPMILNKKVKKNKPKVRPDKFAGGGYNYSVGELASPGLDAITSAAEELSPNKDEGNARAKVPLMMGHEASTGSKEILVAAGSISPDFHVAQQKAQQFLQVESIPAAVAKKKKVTCNCKKSRCLKLYCDCFRYEFYCDPTCNCVDCANIERFEEERIAARQACLERNQDAFKPRLIKSGVKPELAGCHCKKSACLKKYCECFTAIIPCTDRCVCTDCKNTLPLYNPASAITHPFLGQQRPPGGSSSQAAAVQMEVEDQYSQLSQASLASDLISSSQAPPDSQDSVNSAGTLLQLAGINNANLPKTPAPASPSASYGRVNRSVIMSFSSFSMSVSGLDSPVVHQHHSTTSTSHFAIPPLPSSNSDQTPMGHTTTSTLGSTGITPMFSNLNNRP